MAGVKRTIAPASEPITVAEAKAHLKVDVATDDTYIGTLISAARSWAEGYMHRAILPQTFEARFDGFPSDAESQRLESLGQSEAALELPFPPLADVASVEYVDPDGVEQTLDASKYEVLDDSDTEPARIVPSYGNAWPSTRPKLNSVTVTYTAGWANAAAVPPEIKQGLLQLIAHWYENREAVNIGNIVSPVPMTIEAAFDPFRILTAA